MAQSEAMSAPLGNHRPWHAKTPAAILVGLCAWQAAAFGDPGAGTWSPKPVIVQNPGGRLEIFEVDRDGNLNHRWQKEASGDWSTWSSLGGSLAPEITVANNADGTLEVFGVDAATAALKCIRQVAPDRPGWGDWVSLGGAVRRPVAGQDLDGRLEVFAVQAQSNAVTHIWQTNIHEGWSAWADLGGAVEPEIAVGKNRDGRLELFGVDVNNKTLVHLWQSAANSVNSWAGWASLGNSILPGLAAGQNADGSLEVFAVNRTNGAVDHLFQIFGNRGIAWSPWLGLEGNVKPGLTLGQNADGRLETFAVRREDAALLHCFQNRPTASNDWSGWLSLGGSLQSSAAAVRNPDGTLQVFAVDAGEGAAIIERRQIVANGEWLAWSGLEHSTFQYTPRTWQTDDGLPHNLVEAIAQTPDGYLWVGTRAGLARFDGVQFTTFDAKNTPAIKNSFITSLYVDPEGTLWIATLNGLVRLKDGVFSRYDRTDGLAGNELSVVAPGKDGSLWIGTMSGLSQFKDQRFTNYTRKQGLLSDIVRDIYEDRESNLWIATPEGLNCLKAGRLSALTTTNGLPHRSLRRVFQDRAGRFWIGLDAGIAWLNKGKVYAYNTTHGLSDNIVSALCDDGRGDLWVGTYSGLNRFRDGRFFSELNNDGLPFDKVNAIFGDREGNLWVGSREGLTRFVPKRFVAYTKRQGLTHNNVMSVLGDRNGGLWIGTWGGGINLLKDDRFTAYTTANGLRYDLVLSTCEARDGSLWIGMDYDGGLTRLKDGKFTHYTKKDGLLDAAVRVIHEDQSGTLWIGTSRGLCRFKDGEFSSYTTKDHLGGNVVRAISEDHAGELWFGTDGGLSRWNRGQIANLATQEGLSDNAVLALYEDEAQSLWIGTAGGGLNRHKAGRFTAYTTQQGMFSDEVLAILEDDHGWLWLSCSKGVSRVLKKDLDSFDLGKSKSIICIAYGKADGMESTLCNGVAQPAGWKTADGRLWFPTTKGLVAVDPNIEINQTPPPVFVEQVFADKKPVLGLRTSDFGLRTWRIPPGRGEIEFRFTALNFQMPEKTLFKYQLEGVDSEWVEAGARRSAHYNNIYPGKYRFRVIACNSDGVWNENGDALAILVRPHFWQTWWFQVLAALAGVAAVGGSALFVTKRRMQRKLELLEQQHAIEKERGRIAKDIHDELGSSLTRIMMLGERAEEDAAGRQEVGVHVHKIVASARATVQSLDEIVWAVNPENDTVDGLVGYLSQYANQFFDATGVKCRLEMPVALSGLTLPAELRHDLFLVVKEALNNVVKHSRASEVRVRLAEQAATIEIGIEDNGCGFDADGAGSGRKGNGLANMRKRMDALGGKFSLHTAPGQGTSLGFTVALNGKPDRSG